MPVSVSEISAQRHFFQYRQYRYWQAKKCAEKLLYPLVSVSAVTAVSAKASIGVSAKMCYRPIPTLESGRTFGPINPNFQSVNRTIKFVVQGAFDVHGLTAVQIITTSLTQGTTVQATISFRDSAQSSMSKIKGNIPCCQIFIHFPIEAHYKNLEDLVPKHPPDGIMQFTSIFLHFHSSVVETNIQPLAKMNQSYINLSLQLFGVQGSRHYLCDPGRRRNFQIFRALKTCPPPWSLCTQIMAPLKVGALKSDPL